LLILSACFTLSEACHGVACEAGLGIKKAAFMKKNIYIILLIVILVIIASIVFLTYKPKTEIILFYSIECPHCEKVRNFIATNNIHNVTEKEISQNSSNLMQLIKIQKRCGIPVKSYVEIPLLWTGTKCVTGDQDIIKFFKQKTTSQ